MSSYGHKCTPHWFLGPFYRISWCLDRHYSGSRLRFPTCFRRDTDEAGARRFCKKWGIEFVEAKPPKEKQ